MLRRFAFVGSTSVVILAAFSGSLGIAAGCRHDRPDPEPAVDAPKVDVNNDSKAATPPVTVLKDGVDQEPNFACASKPRMEPAVIYPDAGTDEAGVPEDAAGAPDGTLVQKQIELIGFGTGGSDLLKNQVVDVYYNNTFASGMPDVTVTSDDKALFTVLLPKNKRVGYHVHASDVLDDYYGLDDLHYPVPPITQIRWQGVTKERRDFFALALTGEKTWRPSPGTGIVAGRVMDCDRRYIQYAEVVLYDEDAKAELPYQKKCGTGLCRVYLTDAELPDVGREYTSRSSLFAILDVPVGKRLSIIAYSTSKDGTTKVPVASRKVEIKADVINTQFLEPDAPKW